MNKENVYNNRIINFNDVNNDKFFTNIKNNMNHKEDLFNVCSSERYIEKIIIII